jgi:hypothetical protein
VQIIDFKVLFLNNNFLVKKILFFLLLNHYTAVLSYESKFSFNNLLTLCIQITQQPNEKLNSNSADL